ncbi:MAG TPA: DNA translocase FtsK, partial [Gaiellaceae bacterium]|nr:DNA translocase FtsK [Gaiellaceae bacterium]
MARKQRSSRPRPKSPARLRKAKRARRTRGRQHHELLGLGLFCLGLFLAFVTWLDGSGGIVGDRVDAALDALVGSARVGVPVVLVAVGALMVARASLVDVKPFRTGLVLAAAGALVLLGDERGGGAGRVVDAVVGRLLGGTGSFILGLFLLWAGALLLTGASLGAVLRRSARVARDTAAAARRTVDLVRVPVDEEAPPAPRTPPVDGEQAYPDVVGDAPGPHPVLVDQLAAPGEPEEEPEAAASAEPALFDPPTSEHAGYRLPDPGVLKRSRPHEGQPAKAAERTAEALLQALANFGIDATLVGQVVGPRVTRYELQLAPGTKVGKVAALKDDLAYALATTEIRILAPIPGKQAVGVEVPNLAPNIVTLGDIFDEL